MTANETWLTRNVLLLALGIAVFTLGYRGFMDETHDASITADVTTPVTEEAIGALVDEAVPGQTEGGPSTPGNNTDDPYATDDHPSLEGDAMAGRLTEAVAEQRSDVIDSTTPDGLTEPDSDLGTGVLRFVYFIEADESTDPEAIALIDQQAVELQQFWYDQFGGTFHLPVGGVDVVYGQHPAQWYDEEPNGDDPRWYRLMNIRAEVRAGLGLQPGDDVRMVAYPSARIDGRVGANRYGGAWMDGDDLTCVSGEVETIPYSLDYPASCLATVAHELGHVYGLGHLGEDADCMQFGFYTYVIGNDRCSFSAENREMVVSDPNNSGWLDAKPGDRR
ncbi:MAG: hypothetical protein GY724_08955 [Actinomycetia bacterium]|nr:hypothetical protein [Actinomycetes bacterium]MCP4222163.1 hypothetical protein [Actinomycetes bacterium]MCP5035164.1 hypothetical protein [Actinomycetes bacterium]